MPTKQEIIATLHALKPELQARFKVKAIGLFGSYVRGDQSSASDVDVLVEFGQPVGWEVVDLHEYLEKTLGMKIDLVTKGAVTRKPLLWQAIQEDLVLV